MTQALGCSGLLLSLQQRIGLSGGGLFVFILSLSPGYACDLDLLIY
jgi:hypothetical protein